MAGPLEIIIRVRVEVIPGEQAVGLSVAFEPNRGSIPAEERPATAPASEEPPGCAPVGGAVGTAREPAAPLSRFTGRPSRMCLRCGTKPAWARSKYCRDCIGNRGVKVVGSAGRLPSPSEAVAAARGPSAPQEQDGAGSSPLVRSGGRMPLRPGVGVQLPAGWAECRCGRLRKVDELCCAVCAAMRMKAS